MFGTKTPLSEHDFNNLWAFLSGKMPRTVEHGLTYTDLETVISYIQERPRPLALYINSFNEEFQESLLKHTHSGGVCINEAAFHVAQEDLPFGGIGNSGMGRIHGKEGFRTFSNQKAVFHKGKISLSDKFFPPFGSKIHKFLTKVLIR